jgi:hypothetical protein
MVARNEVAAPGGQINLKILTLLVTLRTVVDDDVVRRDAIGRQTLCRLVHAVGDGDLAPPRHEDDPHVDREIAGHLLAAQIQDA